MVGGDGGGVWGWGEGGCRGVGLVDGVDGWECSWR